MQTIENIRERYVVMQAEEGLTGDTAICDSESGWSIVGSEGNDIASGMTEDLAMCLNRVPDDIRYLLRERKALREALRRCLCSMKAWSGGKVPDKDDLPGGDYVNPAKAYSHGVGTMNDTEG